MRYSHRILVKLLIIVSLCTTFSTSADSSARRNELISVIDLEFKEVTRLNKQMRNSNPELLLRMAELLLEKARLVKELENDKFMSLSSEQRAKSDKKKYFKRSTSYFVSAQRTCELILKKFPRFKGKSDVYYIMAYNAKEFQQEKKAQNYFSKSIGSSKKKDFTNTRSQIALAEIYFNQGKYEKAIPLYRNAFSKKSHRDKWYTKDSYNLAWSYYRTGQKKRAIRIMRNAYDLSKSSKYVDMSFSIERDLAYFYTDSGRVNEAVKFYKEIGKNIAANLLKVSTYLMNRGKYSQAEKTLIQALKYKVSEAEEIEINIKLLSLYEKFGKYDKHLKVSTTLVNYNKAGKLNPEQVKILDYHLRRVGAILQKQVTGKQYKQNKSLQSSKAALAVGYFDLLMIFDAANSYKYSFLGAETYYSAGMMNESAKKYSESSKLASAKGVKKYEKLSNEGMMASLGGSGVSKETKGLYLESVYINFLKENPRSKKSDAIYQRLFSLYFSKNDIPSCESTLISYRKNFPKSYSTQEAMLARIMDHYKKKGDVEGIKNWVKRINSGEFRVSKNYAKKVRMTLLTMQFEGVEKANTKGEKKEALRLYVEIYKDETSTKEAKKNAAYNIAILFHELGDNHRSFGWAQRALSHMSGNNVKRFQSSFLVIANDLFSGQMFVESAEIYETVFDKVCKVRTNNKEVFLRNAVIVQLAEGNSDKAASVLKSAYGCAVNPSVLDDLELEMLDYYVETKSWNQAVDQAEKLSKSKRVYKDLIYPLGKIRNAYLAAGRSSNAREIEKKMMYYYSKVRNPKEVQLEGLDEIASISMQDLDRRISSLTSFELAFPDKTFNTLLKRKFQELDGVTTSAVKLMNIGSGKGMMKAYAKLIYSYNHVINEIENFKPTGKSDEYVQSFKKSMKNLVAPLSVKVVDFKREAIKQMKTSKIMSEENVNILYENVFVPQYLPNNNGILMDRGGSR
ncbi:tetratricopeptide repeat protein [Halobacteriovorax sp. HLS]|uniref:tetratricopeptide repeat protein n=1 Tax=Halobacteriovorax sp. HLS TaxID=2234000 RepID=UPI0013E34B58|nr:tetratricopeptide repeat protein [Halobacteriovorax sp. HLS]